ncbi:MAG: hypothetical protein KDK39_05780 [Leptospiraceae bacterium]|nr:hypothetical protein [Leptospiraceae bacterium]
MDVPVYTKKRLWRSTLTGLAVCSLAYGCQSANRERDMDAIDPADVKAIVKDQSVSKRSGCIQGDCQNGEGTYLYPNGYRYRGSFKDGQRDGEGSLEYPNGDIYTGNFSANQRSGRGKYRFGNGDYYEGEFQDGQRIGKGLYAFAQGGVFEGEFGEDGRRGQGLFYLTDEDTLECELKSFSLFCDLTGKEHLRYRLNMYSHKELQLHFEGNR